MSDTPPARFRPQLAHLVKTIPSGPEWVHEIKYDGYRIGCRIARPSAGSRRDVTLYSRNNRDWTATFPEIAKAARELHVQDAFFDGEVAVLMPDGRTNFQALQNAIASTNRSNLVYFVFDVLFLNGEDLSALPLERRKARLKALLAAGEPSLIRYSDDISGNAESLLEAARRLHLEGIVSKRRDLPYHAGRHDSWVKTKCINRQEFVIGGFTDPEGSRQGLGALLVGYYEQPGQLVFAGKVGTGFTNRGSVELRKRLETIACKTTPFVEGLDTWLARHAHWARPELVAEVAFTEWTDEGNLRHPSFQGLRADKPPIDIRRERAEPVSAPPPTQPTRVARSRPGAAAPGARERRAEVGGVPISHPERVMYPDIGLTKLDLARYYDAVADRMLPHVLGRPLTLVRCGQGLPTGEMRRDCIYMKHAKVWAPPSVRRVNIRERTKVGEYLVVESTEALLGLVQMDVLEIHAWNSTVDHIEQPDRLVIDIDPGPDVPWPWVVEAARLVRSVLHGVELESFVKTTGGAGLHVVVPLVPSRPWDECLEFSREIAAAIVRTDPDRYTTSFPKRGRERKLLIDYLRNNRTNTSVAAFSTRARPAASVSLPISWETLTTRLIPAELTAQTVPRRLARTRVDPWKQYWTVTQRITAGAAKAVRTFR